MSTIFNLLFIITAVMIIYSIFAGTNRAILIWSVNFLLLIVLYLGINQLSDCYYKDKVETHVSNVFHNARMEKLHKITITTRKYPWWSMNKDKMESIDIQELNGTIIEDDTVFLTE